MRLLKVNGSGFDALNVNAVRFSNTQGYSVDVPVVDVTAKTLTVHVPPFIDMQTGAYGPGTVNVQAIQTSSGATSTSNALTGFQIQDLPVVSSPAGATTLSLLKASLTVAQLLQTDIKNTTLDTPAVNTNLSTQIANLQSLIPQVQAVVQNPGQTFSLGSYNQKPITVASADLRNVDRLIVSLLQSTASGGQAASPSPELLSILAPTDTCDGSQATTFAQNAQQAGSNADIPGAQEFVYGPRQQVLCHTADAFNTTFKVVGGSAAVGLGLILLGAGPGAAAAVALATGALLYVTIVGAAGMIGLGGARGQTSPGAMALVKGGIDKIEETLYGTAKLILPQTTAALAAIGLGGHSLYQALATAPVHPSGFSISPGGVSGVVSCILNPPPGGDSTFNLFSGNISVIAPVGQAWSATVLPPPEGGAIVTVTPSSGTGPMSVNVNVRYPHKLCTCPCSLSWNSGSIVRFAPSGGSTSSTLAIAVSTSNCTCSAAPLGDFGLCTVGAAKQAL